MLAWRWLCRLVICLAMLVVARVAPAQDLSTAISSVLDASINNLHESIGNKEVFAPGFNFDALVTTDVLRSAFARELGSFPIGSSSGGFAYSFDSSSGVAVRSSASFGPAFAERPFTSGRGTFNLGVTFLQRRFTHLEGLSLEDGDVKFGTR